ncbi:MAG: hypothetical protein J5I92_03615 [Thiogranum sp.]|nr:hypothetical protein [Thiogranum sp.]
MRDSVKFFLLAAIVTLITACGGGGSGGGDTTVAISSTPVAITPANAETVAATTFDAAIGLDEASLGASSIVGAVTTTSNEPFDLTDFAQRQLQRGARLFAESSGALATGVIISGSEPCSSGSFSYTLDDADNNSALSTGDSFSLQFNSCSDGTTTINGGLSLTGVIVSGDIETPVAPYSVQATFSFNNLSVSESGETATVAGSITINLGSTDGVTLTSQLSGSSVLLTAGADSARISNFNFSASENLNTGAWTISVDATIDSNIQGGRTVLVTITPFEGFDFDDPYTGEALITGANNSSVRIIVLDAVNVRLEVDEDGDGTAETTIDTTWAQLRS